jgi:hypothetical protein
MIYIYIYMRDMVVTCYKNYGTPLNYTGVPAREPLLHALGSRRHWKMPPAAVLLPLSRGADFLSAVFWHPRFSDRQLIDADGVISLVASEKRSRLGFASSRMLLPWQ